MKSCIFLLAIAMSFCAAASAASIAFPQCPATGVNTGCEFLITITNTGSTIAQDPNAPNNGPYDASEDTLVGVLNSSTSVLASLPLSSSLSIFRFDGDGPCTQTPKPGGCPGSGGFGPTGYEGPGVSFSNISSNSTSGTVNFGPALAPGGTAWFALEDVLQASQIVVGTGTPEPGTWIMMATGFAALAGLRRRFTSIK